MPPIPGIISCSALSLASVTEGFWKSRERLFSLLQPHGTPQGDVQGFFYQASGDGHSDCSCPFCYHRDGQSGHRLPGHLGGAGHARAAQRRPGPRDPGASCGLQLRSRLKAVASPGFLAADGRERVCADHREAETPCPPPPALSLTALCGVRGAGFKPI